MAGRECLLPTGCLPLGLAQTNVRKWRISAVQAVTPKGRVRLNRLLICAWRIEAACKKSERMLLANSGSGVLGVGWLSRPEVARVTATATASPAGA
jgi:hypothetical protein